MPRGHERAEALPGRAAQTDVDGVVGQPGAALPARHLAAEHRADGAVHVADRAARSCTGWPVLEGRLRQRVDQLLVERLVEAVILRSVLEQRLARTGSRHREDRREVEARAPSSARRPRGVSSTSAWPIASAIERKPSAARCSRTSSAMNSKKLTTNSGLPVKRLRSSGFCVATPTGQVSRWQTRIITQPRHHQRRGGEAELLGAEQRGDHDVAAGLQLAVALHDDAVAQAVEQQRLLRLGDAELPRRAGVLERRERRGAGAAVVAGDEHHVGVRLRDAGGDGADADLRRPASRARGRAGSSSSGRG